MSALFLFENYLQKGPEISGALLIKIIYED